MNSTSTVSKTLLSVVLFLGLTAVCSVALGDSVTVFTTNFNAGAPPEFSGVTTTEEVQGYAGLGNGLNVFSGDFLRNTSGGNPLGTPGSPTTLTLTGLPAHSSINLNFLLAIIDSWDGETCCFDPDIFNVRIDGNLIFSESFTNISSEHFASYPSPTTPANVVLAQEVQLGFGLDDFSHRDSAYNMGLEPTFQNIPHTSSTLTIEWFASGGGWQGGSDESWAIDNVEVILNEGAGCLTPPSGMTGWWPGDGNTDDIVGGRNAVLKNGATFAASLVDKGFHLDGIDDFVEVPHDPALNVGTGDFTVDFWVNFNTTDGQQVLVEKYVENFSETPPGWFLTKLEDNSLRFGTGPALPDHGVDSPPLLLLPNMWIHFTARRSGGVASIFVNGQEVATGLFVDNADSDSSLKFGHRGNPIDTPGSMDDRGFFLNGRIDEVEMFVGRALSDTEIQAIVDAGSAGKCGPQIVNDKVNFVVQSTSFNPASVPGGPAGTFTVTAVLTNTSTESIREPINAVVRTLTNGNKLLSATVGNGGAGSKQAIDAGSDDTLIPNESRTVQFRIGLANRHRFSFFVDVSGIVSEDD